MKLTRKIRGFNTGGATFRDVSARQSSRPDGFDIFGVETSLDVKLP
jgi:hypothetical protein